MTLQQLEYVLALEKTRHFVRAAEMCNVTQPTLSAMIQKLEDELDCKIFDRSKHPVELTQMGEIVVQQAQVVLYNANQLKENIHTMKGELSGPANLAIIPTIAPYLLPKLIKKCRQLYPNIALKITEFHTKTIVEKLRMAEIDIAILSTPLNDPDILEIPLYYEKFVAYISPDEKIYCRKELSANDMPLEDLWVLEEGHCMRNQVFNFCNEEKVRKSIYEAGSIDTLVKIVEENGGYTVLPELHIDFLTEEQRQNLRPIVNPEAVREVSLVIRHDFVREGILNALANCVKEIIPSQMIDSRLKKFAIKI
jgi:LysR family hydrogen peroxide-inducible transcriptional activator